MAAGATDASDAVKAANDFKPGETKWQRGGQRGGSATNHTCSVCGGPKLSAKSLCLDADCAKSKSAKRQMPNTNTSRKDSKTRDIRSFYKAS